MSAILDNITFFKLIRDYVLSAISKSKEVTAGFTRTERTMFDSTFLSGDRLLPMTAVSAGRNTIASTTNVTVANGVRIRFPNNFNYAHAVFHLNYWCLGLNAIKNYVGENAILVFLFQLIRETEGVDTELARASITVHSSDAPLFRYCTAICGSSGVSNNSEYKIKVTAVLYPDKTDTSTSYTNEQIFEQYPNLSNVGAIENFNAIVITGVRQNLMGISSDGGQITSNP